MQNKRKQNLTSDFYALQQNEKCVRFQREHCVTDDLMHRLSLFAELEGHTGCVNCLQWNDKGTLLASGSDDYRVILWDPFARRKLHELQTGHVNNIFSVQFVPETDDRILATGAGDGKVRLHDVIRDRGPNSNGGAGDSSIQVYSCHFARVKRVVTHRAEPHLLWSAGEDGLVMQFDIREPAHCRSYCNHAIVNLNAHLGPDAEIKCLALNPARSEMMAVGANDHYVRVFDRRMLCPKVIKLGNDDQRRGLWDRSAVMSLSLENVDYSFPQSSAQYYIAGHLAAKRLDKRLRYRPLTATYLAFSPCGRDLLVNLGGEQIYLFDMYDKKRSLLEDFRHYFDSFPSKSDEHHHLTVPNGIQKTSVANGLHRNPFQNGYSNGFSSFIQSLTKTDVELHKADSSRPYLSQDVDLIKQKANAYFSLGNFNMAVAYYSQAVQLAPRAAVLYCNRAAAYMRRDWDGDIYAALRDCYVTLRLDPSNLKALFRLAKCLYDLKQFHSSQRCLEIFRDRYPDQAKTQSCLALWDEITNAIHESQEAQNRAAASSSRKRTRTRSLNQEDCGDQRQSDVDHHGDYANDDDQSLNSPPRTRQSTASQHTTTTLHHDEESRNVDDDNSQSMTLHFISATPRASSSSGRLAADFHPMSGGGVHNESGESERSSNNLHIDVDYNGSSSERSNEDSNAAPDDPNAYPDVGSSRIKWDAGRPSWSGQEVSLREAALDYTDRFCGHCNTTTDIKEANFFGCNGEYIVGGSDDGKFFIWDRKTCNVIRALVGDESIVNCLQPHPYQCLLASSGIESTVKLWSPRPDDGSVDSRDVLDQSDAAQANQRRMNADPIEVMLINMGFRFSSLMEPPASTGSGQQPSTNVGSTSSSSSAHDSSNAPALQCYPS